MPHSGHTVAQNLFLYDAWDAFIPSGEFFGHHRGSVYALHNDGQVKSSEGLWFQIMSERIKGETIARHTFTMTSEDLRRLIQAANVGRLLKVNGSAEITREQGSEHQRTPVLRQALSDLRYALAKDVAYVESSFPQDFVANRLSWASNRASVFLPDEHETIQAHTVAFDKLSYYFKRAETEVLQAVPDADGPCIQVTVPLTKAPQNVDTFLEKLNRMTRFELSISPRTRIKWIPLIPST